MSSCLCYLVFNSACNSTRNPTLWFSFTPNGSHWEGRGCVRQESERGMKRRGELLKKMLYCTQTQRKQQKERLSHWKYRTVTPLSDNQLQKLESTKTQMPRSHDGASAPFLCWLWLTWWIPVWLRWVVGELWCIKAILVYMPKNRS